MGENRYRNFRLCVSSLLCAVLAANLYCVRHRRNFFLPRLPLACLDQAGRLLETGPIPGSFGPSRSAHSSGPSDRSEPATTRGRGEAVGVTWAAATRADGPTGQDRDGRDGRDGHGTPLPPRSPIRSTQRPQASPHHSPLRGSQRSPQHSPTRRSPSKSARPVRPFDGDNDDDDATSGVGAPGRDRFEESGGGGGSADDSLAREAVYLTARFGPNFNTNPNPRPLASPRGLAE